jgi:hypothetical protein
MALPFTLYSLSIGFEPSRVVSLEEVLGEE